MKNVPYYSQWESRHLVHKFISREMNPKDDPLWRRSGAKSAEEYARWSPNICGLACLKMILEFRFGAGMPLLKLVDEAVQYGAYRPELGDAGMRLTYRPFVEMLKARFGMNATVLEDSRSEDIEPLLRRDHLFMASVHPSIRHAGTISPPERGGHLVLVFDVDHQGEWVFHNPSGLFGATQANVRMRRQTFDEFFANRGILIAP